VSEPKRYKVGKIGTTEMIDCVSYDDYARIKAEVERLTKAGDELWEFAKLADTNAPKARRKALKDWHAAKEGKPRA
jgi:hypothetical protein